MGSTFVLDAFHASRAQETRDVGTNRALDALFAMRDCEGSCVLAYRRKRDAVHRDSLSITSGARVEQHRALERVSSRLGLWFAASEGKGADLSLAYHGWCRAGGHRPRGNRP